ncbi:MAG: hypothetical protein ACF8OB_04180, partial [Phycisphaeraceae bacterium JB051]
FFVLFVSSWLIKMIRQAGKLVCPLSGSPAVLISHDKNFLSQKSPVPATIPDSIRLLTQASD